MKPFSSREKDVTYLWVGILCFLLMYLLGVCVEAKGQCENGVCPPQQQWQAPRIQNQQPILRPSTRPIPAVCRIIVHRNGHRVYGTGVLIWRGSKKAVVLTVQHLFRPDCNHQECRPVPRRDCRRRAQYDRAEVIFPNGEKREVEEIILEDGPDLGALTIPTVDIVPMAICLDKPTGNEVGGLLYQCGYGEQGDFQLRQGKLLGFGTNTEGRRWDVVISGAARSGDSGAPFFNTKGEIVGILWGTDGESARGAYNARICQFVSDNKLTLPWMDNTDRFAPWNARTEQEKIKAAAELNKPQAPPLVPVAPPYVPITPQVASVIDPIARNMAQSALDGVESLAVAVRDSDEASIAAIAGNTKIAEEAKEKAEEASIGIVDLEKSLAERIFGGAKTAVIGLLKSWGIPGGFLIVGVAFFFVRKYVAMQIAQAIDKITDLIPGDWDDKMIDPIAYKTASILSGKPIPDYAFTPGVSPWNKPYADFQPPTPTEPPSSPEKEVAELKARLAGLESQIKPIG